MAEVQPSTKADSLPTLSSAAPMQRGAEVEVVEVPRQRRRSREMLGRRRSRQPSALRLLRTYDEGDCILPEAAFGSVQVTWRRHG